MLYDPKEMPDFQSEELDVGLEITEAITLKHGEDRKIINQYFGQGLPAQYVKECMEKQFPKTKGKIEIINDMAVYKEHCGSYNTLNHIDLIMKSIQSKTKKLNSIYKMFKHNWLYIFSHTSVLNVNDIEYLDTIYEPTNCSGFNIIFINCIDKIYIIERLKQIKQIIIDENTLKDIKSEAFSILGENIKQY
jgi:hypothetical protein